MTATTPGMLSTRALSIPMTAPRPTVALTITACNCPDWLKSAA
jgi:hypothetical protein